MKADVLYAPGDLRCEEVPMPLPFDGEVIVKVKAAGVCGSDLDRVMHTGTYRLPCIPGHEFCGEIYYPEKCSSGLMRGDRIIAAPIIPCRNCEPCQRGDFGLCDNYDYIGSRRDGAFAQYVRVPEENLIKMPDTVSFLEGAAVEPAAVSLHGVKRAKIQAGDYVMVLGCGTIGLFAIQFTKIMGACFVVAVDVDPSKLEQANTAGADLIVDSSRQDPIEILAKLTNGRMADVVIETAGISITQEQSVRAARKAGRILFLGTAHKDVVFPPKTFERIVRGELTAIGSWNSFSAPFPGSEWHTVLGYINNGRFKIKPFISHTTTLEDLPSVIARMSTRQLVFTKVIVALD
jgi:L-iditol 2-dehydrogenase